MNTKTPRKDAAPNGTPPGIKFVRQDDGTYLSVSIVENRRRAAAAKPASKPVSDAQRRLDAYVRAEAAKVRAADAADRELLRHLPGYADEVGTPVTHTELAGMNGPIELPTSIASLIEQARELGIRARGGSAPTTITTPAGETITTEAWVANMIDDFVRENAVVGPNADACDRASYRALRDSGVHFDSDTDADAIAIEHLRRSGIVI